MNILVISVFRVYTEKCIIEIHNEYTCTLANTLVNSMLQLHPEKKKHTIQIRDRYICKIKWHFNRHDAISVNQCNLSSFMKEEKKNLCKYFYFSFRTPFLLSAVASERA